MAPKRRITDRRGEGTGNVCVNVTSRRVRVTTVAAEKQLVLYILSVCL